jgi:hypothetical protein
MATSIKISQLPAKGANLEATDLLEVSEFNGTGYVSKSITGQEIIDASTGGGVTDVTASAPLASSGGSTPDISMAVADAGHDGYLSSTDWNTFNDKQEQLVSGTNIKTINGSSVLGSGDLVVSGGGGASAFNAIVPLGSGGIYSNIPVGASNSTQNLTANIISLMPFIPAQTFTTSNIFLNITGTTSANARILIYSHNSSNGLPNTLLYESVNIDGSTLGIKTVTTSQTFIAGTTYWLGLYTSGTLVFSGSATGGLMQVGVDFSLSQYTNIQRSVAFGSAPTTWGTTHTKTNNSFARIGLTSA